MQEFRAAKKRFFQRFSQWYYNEDDVKATPRTFDVPELVLLLKAAGFTVTHLGFPNKRESLGMAHSTTANGGCTVRLECASSGLRAELHSTPGERCRCNRFVKEPPEDPHELQERASFWSITSSQENLRVTGTPQYEEQGSSLLPQLDPERLVVMREVIQVVSAEMAERPPPTRRPSTARLNTTGYSLTSVNRSLEALNMASEQAAPYSSIRMSASHDELLLMNASIPLEMPSLPATKAPDRRASISCCEEMRRDMMYAVQTYGDKQQAMMTNDNGTFKAPAAPSGSISSVISNESSSSAVTFKGETAELVLRHLQSLSTQISELMVLVDPSKVTGKPPMMARKTAFVVPKTEGVMGDDAPSRKKARVAPLPPPRTNRTDMLRNRVGITKSLISAPAPLPMKAPKTDPPKRRSLRVVEGTAPATAGPAAGVKLEVPASLHKKTGPPVPPKTKKPAPLPEKPST